MSNLQNMICPTCKQLTQQADNEIIEYLAKEKDRYRALLGERTEELIRTRKALDVAVDALKRIKFRGEHSKYECCKVSGIIAQDTINKITALEQKEHFADASKKMEQKESAFVHNKIEFPEYNDGLLEEFDKQFFENGQDDDLTETALEQKEEQKDE